MVNFPTRIPDCDSPSPALLDLFLSSDASICSTMAFPLLGNSDHSCLSFHWFYVKLKTGCLVSLLCLSRADCDSLRDHLRDIRWGDIFKINASAAANEICEWALFEIDVYIPHRKYQVKPHLSPWLSAASAAAIVHKNHFFCWYQQNKSSEVKVKFKG